MPESLKEHSPGAFQFSKRIFGNLAYLMGGKAAAGVVSLIYMIVAARVLGPEGYGVLVLVHAFAMTVGGVIALPGWHGLVRYGVRFLGDGNQGRLARLASWLGLVELAGGLAAMLVAALLAPLVGPRLGWTPEAQHWFPFYSFAVLASVRGTPGGYLQLVRRFDLIGLHNLITPAIRLFGSCAAALLGWGLSGFLAVWLVAAIAEGISLWGIAYAIAPANERARLTFSGLGSVPHDNEGLIRFSLTANADLAVAGFSGWVTPLILGWALGPAGAALFSIAQRVTIIFVQPAQLLGQAAYAELVRILHDTGDRAAVRRALFQNVGLACLIAVPIMLLLAAFSTQVVEIVAGPAYAAAASVLIWLCVARAIALTGPPTSAALTALGHPGVSLFVNLTTGAMFVAALPVFVSHFGLVGAGIHAFVQSVVAIIVLSTGLFWFTRAAIPDQVRKQG